MEKSVNEITSGKTSIGIELGSTRIKAVLIGSGYQVLASGGHDWENKFVNGYWTYSLEEIWAGLAAAYADLKKDVKNKYGVTLKETGAIGISAMMHGYLVFGEKGDLLTPFRTWRNLSAAPAAETLTKLFNYKVPARWSIAHLYQAITDKEAHINDIAYMTALEGYIHWQLTGQKVIGIGEASGMFPIDIKTKQYSKACSDKFDAAAVKLGFKKKLADIMPRILLAGENAGMLTVEGAKLLDKYGDLKAGIPLCPPEGDAGTGMVATNAVRPATGNVSAGTSVFGMVVLEKELSKVYPEIDLVTTPSGDLTAMAHCNNCSSEINAWVGIFDEFAKLYGIKADNNDLFTKLFTASLKGDADCGGLIAYNYLSGEHITGVDEGRPIFLRTTEGKFNLANFMRAELYSAFATLKIGFDLLFKNEKVRAENINAHGGIFKTAGVAQDYLAAALGTAVVVTETANQGGAWGMAVLADFMVNGKGESLADYLDNKVFNGVKTVKKVPDKKEIEGFAAFTENYVRGLPVVREAVTALKK